MIPRHLRARFGRIGLGIPFILTGLLVLGAIVLAVVTQRSAPPPELPPAAAEGPDDPRRTFETPFLNVRPDVRYVGDAACAGCQ